MLRRMHQVRERERNQSLHRIDYQFSMIFVSKIIFKLELSIAAPYVRLIRTVPFRLLVDEILQNFNTEVRLSPEAMAALQATCVMNLLRLLHESEVNVDQAGTSDARGQEK